MDEKYSMTESFYIERIVRIISGSLVLISLALAHFHSMYWLWLGGIVSACTFQSGFSQFCPLIVGLGMAGVPRFPKNSSSGKGR